MRYTKGANQKIVNMWKMVQKQVGNLKVSTMMPYPVRIIAIAIRVAELLSQSARALKENVKP